MSRAAEAQQARAARLDMHSQWLADDVDGIAHNLALPGALSTVILTDARNRIASALNRIDRAIATNRNSTRTQEPA